MPRFGTDGLRGVAYSELTPELAFRLGQAAAHYLVGDALLIARDTRESSPVLSRALGLGAASAGRTIIDVGVLPTPGLAHLAACEHQPGAMVSASHNPYYDNGIKLISSSGTKIDDATERAIELENLDADTASLQVLERGWEATVTEKTDAVLVERYIDHLLSCVQLPQSGRRLSVVCDCANGAASDIAPAVLERFGVEVTAICNQPDGQNINDHCGSTFPDRVARAVTELGADVGLSFDGDADRLIAVGHDGTVIDGDQLIALFALDMDRRGELDNRATAITVMSNLGLRLRLEEAGIEVMETPVGDRYVADALSAGGLALGGEQSGHIIFRRDATTGDGILTGLKLLELVARAQVPLVDLARDAMQRLPQELRAVPVAEPFRLAETAAIWKEIEAATDALSGTGRVLVRASGTEPVVRVMVEAPTHEEAIELVEYLAGLVRSELGAEQDDAR